MSSKLLTLFLVCLVFYVLGALFFLDFINFSAQKYYLISFIITIASVFIYFQIYFASMKSKDFDIFSPKSFYLTIYILYFSFLLSFPIIWHSGPINPVVFWLILLSCVGLLLGLKVVDVNFFHNREARSQESPEFRLGRTNNILGYVLYFLGALSISILIIKRGPAIYGDIVSKRFQSHFFGAGYYFYLGFLLNIGLGMLLIEYFLEDRRNLRKSLRIWSLILVAIFLGILYGSRAVIFPTLFQLLLFRHLLKKKITVKTLVISLLILVALTSVFLFARLSSLEYQGWYEAYLMRLNFPSRLWYIAPLVISLRAPIENLSQLINIIPASHDYLYGWISISPFLTALPGKQVLGQEYIQVLLGNDPKLAGLAALTLPGTLYCELGIVAVFVGSFFIGATLAISYSHMIARCSLTSVLIYGNVLSQYFIWIYGGFMANIALPFTIIVIFLINIFIKQNSIKELPHEGALFSILSS